MDLQKLEEILSAEPKFRLKQAYEAMFKNFVQSWQEVTVFSKPLRDRLEKEFPLAVNAKLNESSDGTIKALVTLHDGRCVESVLMRHNDNRNTVCVSCQAGCPMGCAFCATGDMGFFRNLSAGEIVMQVVLFERILKKEERRVTNIVFMGMGEPLYNYAEVMKAVGILNKDVGIAARHISVSTCGIIKGIQKLMDEPLQINLAVSLHAPTNEMRDKIMPVNKSDPVDVLLKTVGDYIKKTNRKVMIEYLLIGDLNNSPETAKELAEVLKRELGHLFVVNVIPYNPTGRFTPPSRASVDKFKDVLEKNGVTVTQRFTFGQEVEGACGQLAIKGEKGISKGRAGARV
jgi:23S rRNA (adenine2503-C2)-methyltransferase